MRLRRRWLATCPRKPLLPWQSDDHNAYCDYNEHMETASISVTKNQLNALIEQVRQGETILITDHDRPAARLAPVATENGQPGTDELALLERKGILRRGHGRICRLMPPVVPTQHASALQTLLEEREWTR